MLIKKPKIQKIYKVGFKHEPKTAKIKAYTEKQAKFKFWLEHILPIQHQRNFNQVKWQLVTKKVGVV